MGQISTFWTTFWTPFLTKNHAEGNRNFQKGGSKKWPKSGQTGKFPGYPRNPDILGQKCHFWQKPEISVGAKILDVKMTAFFPIFPKKPVFYVFDHFPVLTVLALGILTTF